jgi:hypothetical protein
MKILENRMKTGFAQLKSLYNLLERDETSKGVIYRVLKVLSFPIWVPLMIAGIITCIFFVFISQPIIELFKYIAKGREDTSFEYNHTLREMIREGTIIEIEETRVPTLKPIDPPNLDY